MARGYAWCMVLFFVLIAHAFAAVDDEDPVTNFEIWHPRDGGVTTLPLALKLTIDANSSDAYKSRYGDMLICVELDEVAIKCSSTIGTRIRWHNLPHGRYVARAFFSDREHGTRYHETDPVSFLIAGAQDFDAQLEQQIEQIRSDQKFPPDLNILQWAQHVKSEDTRTFRNKTMTQATAFPSDELRLVIGIKTAVLTNFAQRQAIRETWASKAAVPSHVKVFFLGCTPVVDSISDILDRQRILAAVKLERDVYGDLLTDELECDDKYTLLTEKVSAFLEWVAAELPRTEFVMVTDDDVYVRVDKLVEDLNMLPHEGLYVGELSDTLHSAPLRPVRNPAQSYYTPRESYPLEQLPPYAGGPHYLLSMDCVRFIGKNRRRLASLGGLEDTSVALWLLAIQVHVQFTSAFASLRLWFCKDNLLSFADLSPLGMRSIHVNLLNGRRFCHNFDRMLWVCRSRRLA
ncbi:hypothetical protein PI125_g3133 [Phytophthora idaei]|nr:hypothetical protein PI125_g3133 [Phytophthora idaei]